MSDFDRESPTGGMLKWQKTDAQPGESYRWASVDGRWVALSVGTGSELGVAFVSCSDGRRERAKSFEHALAVAKQWRT
jgi:hypothetical protein